MFYVPQQCVIEITYPYGSSEEAGADVKLTSWKGVAVVSGDQAR